MPLKAVVLCQKQKPSSHKPRVMRLQHEILDRLAAIPGVTSVGFGSAAPLESYLGAVGNSVYAEDKNFAQGQVPPIRQIRRIAPGFFSTMGDCNCESNLPMQIESLRLSSSAACCRRRKGSICRIAR